MPCSKKGIGRCHKSGTGNNQGNRRTTPRDNQGFNRNDCRSRSIKMSLPVIRHRISPQTHILFVMPRSKKGLGICHKSGTGNNKSRRRTPPLITGALIATTVTQRALRYHYRWYLFLFHWIIWSSIHLSCPQFVNSHPGIHIAVLMTTNALISNTLTQREMNLVYFLNTIIK